MEWPESNLWRACNALWVSKNEMGRDALWIMAASVYNSAEKILAKSGECPCIPLSEKGYVSYTIHK